MLFNLPERTGDMTETELFSVARNIKKYILSDRNIDFDCHSIRMQVELLITVLYYYDTVFFSVQDIICIYRKLNLKSSRSGKLIMPSSEQVAEYCNKISVSNIYNINLMYSNGIYKILNADYSWYSGLIQ